MIGRLLESRSEAGTPFTFGGSTSASDFETWWGQNWGGNKASSGETVSRRTALTVSEWWRGVGLISSKLGACSMHVLRRTGPESKTRDTEHAAYRLVRRKPNEYMTAMSYRESQASHAVMLGNAYSWIERRGAEPSALLPLIPQATWPVRADSQLYYVTVIGGRFGDDGAWVIGTGTLTRLFAADVLHIKGLGYDGLVGYSVLDLAREDLGASMGMRKFGSIFFKNGAHLGVVLETPNSMRKETADQLRREWAAMHQGLENAHKTVILQDGLKASVLAIDARKAQLVEMQGERRRAIANYLHMHPYWLGDSAGESYNSLEFVTQGFLDDTLDPWMRRFEEEYWDKLLAEDEKNRDTHVIEFNRTELIRIDYDKKRAGIKTQIETGELTLDEARAIDNRGPYPDGLGNTPLISVNLKRLEPAVASDDGADDDLDFKREIIKGWIATGTTSDVIFNLTDARKLLDAVNMPTVANYEEPWLPVVAQAGPLVTGEVITDPAGDIVGGNVEQTPYPAAAGSAVSAGGAPASLPAVRTKDAGIIEAQARGERDEDRRERAKGVNMDDPASVRSAFERLAGERARQHREMREAIEAAGKDAIARMHKRIAGQAERAAKHPEKFIAFCEAIADDNLSVMREACGPALRAYNALRGGGDYKTQCLVICDTWQRQLLELADCKPGELAAAVERWANGI